MVTVTGNVASHDKKNHQLKLVKTLWGIDEAISPALFRSIRDEGYYGVEVIRLAWADPRSRETLVGALNAAGLGVVTQIHTGGGYLDDKTGDYVYCGAYDARVHREDFRKQLEECASLLRRVKHGGFVNVHAGVDAWSNDEARSFLEFCLREIAHTEAWTTGGRECRTVVFETHRQRLFGSPFQTRELLALPSLREADLRLNADLSHWYCACERVFDSAEDRDRWWPTLLKAVAQRCSYIHARFGWAQGPQLADPSAPECERDRRLQVDTWKALVQERRRQNDEEIYVSPEYGPAPYLLSAPHSQEPLASLPAAVSYTKGIIEQLFDGPMKS